MTFKTKSEATKAANALVKIMGPKWQPKVWNNLGWWALAHAENDTVRIDIIPDRKGVMWYTCYMMEPPCISQFTQSKYYRDPFRTLRYTVKRYGKNLSAFTEKHNAIAAAGYKALLFALRQKIKQ